MASVSTDSSSWPTLSKSLRQNTPFFHKYTSCSSYKSRRRPHLVGIRRSPLFQTSSISLCVKATRSAMAMGKVQEVLPPVLDSSSEPPTLFDGTTRLYVSFTCPYCQRVWITRNCKGLQEVIKLVPIDLQNRPAWYKEKVYPANKVPAFEYNNEIKGESLDLVKFIDSNFEGPSLFPNDPMKKEFAEEMFSYTDTLNTVIRNAFSSEGDLINEIGGPFDHLENALSKFEDGPFFLGQYSLVDIAFAPFIERYHLLFLDVKNYDITTGRGKLKLWIEEMNKIDGYAVTKQDPQELVAALKKRYMGK